jgi:hypothetical protein
VHQHSLWSSTDTFKSVPVIVRENSVRASLALQTILNHRHPHEGTVWLSALVNTATQVDFLARLAVGNHDANRPISSLTRATFPRPSLANTVSVGVMGRAQPRKYMSGFSSSENRNLLDSTEKQRWRPFRASRAGRHCTSFRYLVLEQMYYSARTIAQPAKRAGWLPTL